MLFLLISARVFLILNKIMPFEILASLEGVNPDWTSLTLRSIGFLMLLALVAFGVTRLGKGGEGQTYRA